jgi:hypothetical protein
MGVHHAEDMTTEDRNFQSAPVTKEVKSMCDKCKRIVVQMPYGEVRYGTHWVHVADGWTAEEKQEMIKYLLMQELNAPVAKQGKVVDP